MKDPRSYRGLVGVILALLIALFLSWVMAGSPTW